MRASAVPSAVKQSEDGSIRLFVSEPVILSGAVVIARKAEITAVPGARWQVIPLRVAAADGTLIELQRQPASRKDGGVVEFVTSQSVMVKAEESLRFEAVDPEREAYRRLGRWAVSLQRAWAMSVVGSGSQAICVVGFLLIAVGGMYRLFESRRVP